MNKIIVDKMELESKDEIIINELKHRVYDIKKGTKVLINVSEKTLDNFEFNLEENSSLVINKMYNEKDICEEINVNLNGFNSKVNYNFSTLTYNNQKYVININHNNKNTISNIINHGVVMNDSKLEFIVNATVKKGNNKSVLNQESKIIVMGENNSIIKPNLFVDEYDVEAIHAATIGKFSKDDIFYLMTKGINKEDAINLLINGFLKGHMGR